MKDGIGSEIKGFANVILFIGIVLSIITGIIVIILKLVVFGIIVIIVGCFVCSIISKLMYGFGELIEKVSNIESILKKSNGIVNVDENYQDECDDGSRVKYIVKYRYSNKVFGDWNVNSMIIMADNDPQSNADKILKSKYKFFNIDSIEEVHEDQKKQ